MKSLRFALKMGTLTLFFLLFAGCTSEKGVNIGAGIYSENVWERSISENGEHYIETVAVRQSGTEVFVNGRQYTYDDLAIEYNPVINNEGDYAYIAESPNFGYRVLLNGKCIFESKAMVHCLAISETRLFFTVADYSENVSRCHIVEIDSGNDIYWPLSKEYVEDVKSYKPNGFEIIASRFSEDGEKEFSLLLIEDENLSRVITGESDRLLFPNRAESCREGQVIIDKVKLSGDNAYLFNAWYVVFREQRNDPFARANDYRGRISWNQSARLRGLLELYKKTGDEELRQQIKYCAENILGARNGKIGIETKDYTPEYLWTQKAFSVNYEPVSIIVDNCEILGSLLCTLTDGIFTRSDESYHEILDTAIYAFNYYDQYYDAGHYILPYGYPMMYDGAAVPWNW